MQTSYLSEAAARLQEFDGAIAWMYQGRDGEVFVGVRHPLHDVDAATRCAFLRSNAEPASADEIARDFERVRSMPRGLVPSAYRRMHSVLLAHDAIDVLLHDLLMHTDRNLSIAIAGFESFPAPAKTALLDIAVSCGGVLEMQKIMPSRFMDAVDWQHWQHAASSCKRDFEGAKRNVWARAQFLAASCGVVE